MKTVQKVIKVKGGWLELAKPLGNVSPACKGMGDSRDSLYRFKELEEEGGEAALQELSWRKPNIKHRVAPELEEAVSDIALEQPAGGQLCAATELAKGGMPISAAGGCGVGERHPLENLNKRLRALAAKVAPERHILTEAQLAALEQVQGEFERECPE